MEDEEGKKAVIAEYEKKLADMDVLLEELDRKEEELAELKIENEACLEYETMVEEMAQEILKKELLKRAARQSPLGWPFHLRDLLGAGLVEEAASPSGPLLRLTPLGKERA